MFNIFKHLYKWKRSPYSYGASLIAFNEPILSIVWHVGNALNWEQCLCHDISMPCTLGSKLLINFQNLKFIKSLEPKIGLLLPKDSQYIFHLLVTKSHKNVLLTPKSVTLYFYVNMCFKSLFKIMSFSNPLGVTYEFFQVGKTL